MYNILGSIALAYLAGSGSVTNSSVVGRGLFRAIRHIVEGDCREAGAQDSGKEKRPPGPPRLTFRRSAA